MHTSTSKAKSFGTCSQLLYEVIPQFGRPPKIASNYYVISNEEVPCEKEARKKNKKFKRYNLLDPT
jgi:hypothetical protein